MFLELKEGKKVQFMWRGWSFKKFCWRHETNLHAWD